jgi:WD40 repeat protein
MKNRVLALVAAVLLSGAAVPSHLPAETPLRPSATERLIRDLGSSEFHVREQATKKLRDMGEAALEPLRQAKASSQDAEVRQRAGQIIKDVEAALYREVRRFEGVEGVQSVALSRDGRRLLTGGKDKIVRVWEVSTGKVLHGLRGHTGMISCVAFSPDGQRAVSAGEDKSIRLWDVVNGKELRRFLGHSDSIAAVAFSPDGRLLLSGGADATARLWDVESGKELRRFRGHTEMVRTVVFSADGQRALSAGGIFDLDKARPLDCCARVWDVKTGKELLRLEHDFPITYAAFTCDGKYIASTCHEQGLLLWDAKTGKAWRRLFGRAFGFVRETTLSPDGRRALAVNWNRTGHNDRSTMLILTNTDPERLLRCYYGHTREITTVTFSPDGLYALTASKDNTVRMWRLPK